MAKFKTGKFRDVLIFIIIAIVVLCVVFFAFEKPIPKSMAKNTVNALTKTEFVANINSISTLDNFYLKMTDEKLSYNSDNSTVYDYKKLYEFSKTEKDDSFIVEFKTTTYNKSGKVETTSLIKYYMKNNEYIINSDNKESTVSKSIWESGITINFSQCFPIETSSGKFTNVNIFENNLAKVKQKGFNLTLEATKDNTICTSVVNFLTKNVKMYQIIQNYYTSDNTLISTYNTIYELDIKF